MPGQDLDVRMPVDPVPGFRSPLLWAVLVIGLGLAGSAAAQTTVTPPAAPPPAAVAPAAPSPPEPTAPARGSAAWQQLVGNTVVANARTGGYTEFYATDGTVTHLDEDGKSVGKWTVEGDKVCFDFPEEDDRSCVDVETDGKSGTFVDEDKSRDTFTVLAGNAKNF